MRATYLVCWSSQLTRGYTTLSFLIQVNSHRKQPGRDPPQARGQEGPHPGLQLSGLLPALVRWSELGTPESQNSGNHSPSCAPEADRGGLASRSHLEAESSRDTEKLYFKTANSLLRPSRAKESESLTLR